MKAKMFWAVTVLLSLLITTCKQDPILFIISTETAPQKPRIEGAPTNMVVFNRQFKGNSAPVMYIAAGRLHWYAKIPGTDESRWDIDEFATPQPEGKIISLAVAQFTNGASRLYALCRDGNGVNAHLRYLENDGKEWHLIKSNTADIQSIYVAGTQLFAGAGTDTTYEILYLDNNDTLKTLLEKKNTPLLSGAVYKDLDYYLATRGGIFRISKSDLEKGNITTYQLNDSNVSSNKDCMFMSMIQLENNDIIAIEREGGYLYKVSADSFALMRYDNNGSMATGSYATEAVALWRQKTDGGRKLFIVGVQGSLYTSTSSSYTHGYVEFDLNDDGSFDTRYVRRDPSISVDGNTDRYTATLGKHPINYMFQAPYDIDKNMTFFASTQTAGLWSYRNRPSNGGWQWNAESENEP